MALRIVRPDEKIESETVDVLPLEPEGAAVMAQIDNLPGLDEEKFRMLGILIEGCEKLRKDGFTAPAAEDLGSAYIHEGFILTYAAMTGDRDIVNFFKRSCFLGLIEVQIPEKFFSRIMENIRHALERFPNYPGEIPPYLQPKKYQQPLHVVEDFMQGKGKGKLGTGKMNLSMQFGENRWAQMRRWMSEKANKNWNVNNKEDVEDLNQNFLPAFSELIDTYRRLQGVIAQAIVNNVRQNVARVYAFHEDGDLAGKLRIQHIGKQFSATALVEIQNILYFLDEMSAEYEALKSAAEGARIERKKIEDIERYILEVQNMDKSIGFDSVSSDIITAGTTHDIAALAGFHPARIVELKDAKEQLGMYEEAIVFHLSSIYSRLQKAPTLKRAH